MSDDKDLKNEIDAIQSIVSVLKPLNEFTRQRVLDYALAHLGLARGAIQQELKSSSISESQPASLVSMGLNDIRSLKNEKQPRTANEMACLVGYYLSELAPSDERKNSINLQDVRKYFKQAPYPLPKRADMTLPNAAAAGYFDSAGKGEFRLNAVGYNLVAHSLPTQGNEQKIKNGKRKAGPKKKARK